MINLELEKYVSEARARGITDEQLRAELPTAQWNSQDIEEVLQHGSNALLFDAAAPEALESALTRLSHDAALRTHLAAGAAASITRLGLTWRSNAQRVAQLAAALRPAQPAAKTTSGSVKLP